MKQFVQGKFIPKNPAKYIGNKNPMYGIPASDYNKAMTKLKNSGENNPMKKLKNQKVCN
jgi:hypothetical protein